MKKLIFLLCLLFIFACSTIAQTTFQKLIYSNNLIAEPVVSPANKNDFVVTGDILPSFYQAIIALFDKNGNTKWYNYYGDGVSSFDNPVIAQTKDSGFIVVSSTTSDSSVIVKVDKSGNLLWSEYLSGGLGLIPYSISTDNDNVLITGHYGSFPVLIKLNTINGKIIFARGMLPHPLNVSNTFGYSLGVTTANGNGYIVCGWISYFAAHQNHMYAFISKYATNGNYSGTKFINEGSLLSAVIKAADGGYIFAGSNENNGSNACYLKTDNKGNFIWANQIAVRKEADVSAIVHNTDGTYTFTNNGSIANITENGTLNWYKKPNYNVNYLSGLSTTQDNGVIAVSKNGFLQKDSAIIVKFDANGNTCNGSVVNNVTVSPLPISPASFTVDTINFSSKIQVTAGAIKVVKLPFNNTERCSSEPDVLPVIVQRTKDIAGVSVTPNPAQNILHVEGLSSPQKTKLTVVDLNGSIKLQAVANASSYNLNIASLYAGNYLLKIETNGAIVTKQFVKE